MDGRPNRRNKAAFSNFRGVGPETDSSDTVAPVTDPLQDLL